jgi:hypothetical protein
MNDDRLKSIESLLVISVENVKITTTSRNLRVYLLFPLNGINGNNNNNNNKRSEARLGPVTRDLKTALLCRPPMRMVMTTEH